jgi:T5orf172 domain
MMDVRGWVYVISNEAMPDLVKVGFSTKDPNIRAGELGGTGVPHPYVVEYDALVNAPRDVEQKIHQALEDCRVDVSTDTPVGKEWFRCSRNVAIVTIRELTEGTRITEFIRDPNQSARASSESFGYRDSALYPKAALATNRQLTPVGASTDQWNPGTADASNAARDDNSTLYAKAAKARRALAKRGGLWTLSERSLLLAHKTTGHRFKAHEYRYEGDTTIQGFAVKSRELPWVWLEDVEFIE